ncbi:MAG: hypothetical protein ACYS6W_06100 [Planctomycetota bacterium]|jgi:hypothetical protein
MKRRDIWISIAIIIAAFLAFYFYSRQKGQIKIDTKGVDMQLRSGWFSKIRVTSGAEPVTVNARVYRPRSISIATKQNGETWRLNSSGPWGKLAKIRVNNNKTTALQLGPPFTIKPRVNQRGTFASVGFSIIGQAGEDYGTMVVKNGRRLPAPGVKVVDEAGKVLASGKFAYG